MLSKKYLIISLILTTAFVPAELFAQKKPIALNELNPHYFTFRGKPTVLITSAEHYGAVVNLDFDCITYLDELSSKKLNLTRTFTGAYVEPAGAFSITRNTLAPRPERFICPWTGSTTPGYQGEGNKFDLSKWDDAYFIRLKDFISRAQKKGIVVELTFFCPFYEESQWKISPMNNINNINNVGNIDRESVYTLKANNNLLKVQKELVGKIVSELKGFNNLIYENLQ